ncbi:C39 family peptidase [bacterium]|nr:C39 family peptidase [bacterium]
MSGQISGVKWNDYDSDGEWDTGEPGLSNWKIYVDSNLNGNWDDGEPYSSTDQSGSYTLTNLDAGTYVIAEVQQEGWTQTFPEIPASSSFMRAPSTISDELSDDERREIEYTVIDSPPTPPPGFARTAVLQFPRSAVKLSNVPTSRWTYGCSATAAGMLFGYYDRTGYSNMYNGPTNGGVAPLSDLGQGQNPSAPISGSCSIIATMDGFDGRTGAGHVDDYWISYGSSGPDPWESAGVEHTWGGCTADYMGTNQWKWDFTGDAVRDHNTDGSTVYWSSGASKLYDYIPSSSYGLPQTALCHGLRLFAESRGYTVLENYNQKIDIVALGGFSFNDFKDEIDNGYPVLVHVTGHTMIGVGYDDATQTIYIHDTWNNLQHSMTWGGDYSGMTHVAMTVIHLAPIVQVAGTHTVLLGFGEHAVDKDFGNFGPAETDTVRIDWSTPDYCDVIQSAYDSAFDGDSVSVQIGNYSEMLLFDNPICIILGGGFDSSFNAQVGVTNVIGSLTIADGSLTVDRLTVQ